MDLFFNRSGESRKVELNKKPLKLVTYYGDYREKVVLGNFKIKDIWNNKEYKLSDDEIPVTKAPRDVLFLTYEEVMK